MKALVIILSVLATTSLAKARLSKEQKITYHVQVKNWPESLKPVIDQALQLLMAPNQCWSYNSKSKISFAIDYESKEICSLFIAYQDDTKLIPFNKKLIDAKYEISFDEGKNGKPKIALQLFKGNGKKLISAASTKLDFKDETPDSLKDKIVHWSLK